MNESELLEKIREMRAFVKYKFNDLFTDEHRQIALSLFRDYKEDISITTAAAYLLFRYPTFEDWANLVKEHFTNLQRLKPKNAAEVNNIAFSYNSCGFYLDPEDKSKYPRRLVEPFGIGGFVDVVPIYKEAIRLDPNLWEPHYSIAKGLLNLWSWDEEPEGVSYYDIALQHLQRVLEIDPLNVPARLELVLVYHDLYDPIAVCKEVLEIDPNNAQAKRHIKVYTAVNEELRRRFYSDDPSMH